MGLVGVVVVLVLGLGVLVGTHRGASEAQTAADLAALGAAASVAGPPGVVIADEARTGVRGCDLATVIAQRNGAVLLGCVQRGAVVEVDVHRAGPVGGSSATARAGPAWERRR